MIRVGDHVIDLETDGPEGESDRMLVMKRPGLAADEYEYEPGKTVAEANPAYPDSDPVILTAFVPSTVGGLGGTDAYAYPESRLEVVSTLHPQDEQ